MIGFYKFQLHFPTLCANCRVFANNITDHSQLTDSTCWVLRCRLWAWVVKALEEACLDFTSGCLQAMVGVRFGEKVQITPLIVPIWSNSIHNVYSRYIWKSAGRSLRYLRCTRQCGSVWRESGYPNPNPIFQAIRILASLACNVHGPQRGYAVLISPIVLNACLQLYGISAIRNLMIVQGYCTIGREAQQTG